ncbi:cell division cycle 20-like protein 1, cofactor of APC complex [Chaetoceros tenuissimus]|uniref:Cell division cycle 20-like protein 1, cofactor of APC complex n=1 Tax=Chaetoceros tenuissimus TaxID=426638 RepID=A0AAD3H4X0_9STRA|nr:cell division cycle 20-like protein 1, cofactor of APC complex [Chaetoceros tenuissimus]
MSSATSMIHAEQHLTKIHKQRVKRSKSPQRRKTLEVPPSPCATLNTTATTIDPATPSAGSIASMISSGKFSISYKPVLPVDSPVDVEYASRLADPTREYNSGSSYRQSHIPSQEEQDAILMPPPSVHYLHKQDALVTPTRSRSTSITTPTSIGTSRYYNVHSPKRSIGSFTSLSSTSTTSSNNATPTRNAGDRFIPSRATSRLNTCLWEQDKEEIKENPPPAEDRSDTAPSQTPLVNMLLRQELLGENVDPTSTPNSGASNKMRTPFQERNILQYNLKRQEYYDAVYGDVGNDPTGILDNFSLSPVRMSSNHKLMAMPQKSKRKIAKVPFKVLDAPALADDFYLNLVDWSSQNVLAVGLGTCVYLWSACTSNVTKLCDLSEPENGQPNSNQDSPTVTSVSWTQKGTRLAVGVSNGEVQFWDTIRCERLRRMEGHSARIGALSWSGPILASGSRDRFICLRDMRVDRPFTAKLTSHKQEVCGLKWSFDEPAHLASGGNDNNLLVWDIRNHRQETQRFSEHTAAVKAIAWSPHQHGLLASGGGTADRCIKFWNALSGSHLNSIDTGSQVCNLAWAQNCNEIVSTHGYSLNQIAIWKYPTMQKVATLTGHTYRVLYLAMSPDGSTIVTGAGDETLRFWQVFPGPRSNDKNGNNGLLFPSSPFSVLR